MALERFDKKRGKIFGTQPKIIPPKRSDQALYSSSDVCRALYNFDTCCGERRHLLGGRAFAARNDGAGVPHAASRGRSLSGNEPYDRFFERFLDVLRRIFLSGAADFADHHDGIGFGIVLKKFQHVDKRGADERIAPDADARRLSHPELCQLMNGFVSKRAALRHDTDTTFPADVAGNDPRFRFTWRDRARTVRADHACRLVFQVGKCPHHVERWNAFGDTDDEAQARVRGFHDGIGGKCRRDEDHGRIGAGLFHGICHRVEHRPSLVGCPTLSRCDATDDLSPVRSRLLGVKRALFAGEPLNDQPRRFIEKNRHYFASSTTFCAASPIEFAVVKLSPLSFNNFLPSSTFVPSMRMTMGTRTPSSCTAAITPAARMSHRRMPPKILISTARTFLSAIRILKALRICSLFAPPPTSRKFSGSPPASLMMSMVAIARPAPLTMQPIVPSSRM